MAKPESYNPFKIALSLLQEKLDLANIPMVTDKKDNSLISSLEEGFDCDKLKAWLVQYQKNDFKPQRTKEQMSAYEVLQCLRQSYYNRLGAMYDDTRLGQYPFSTIKATMGGIIEQLVLSMYNQIKGGSKWRNSVRINWETNKELGTLYPMNMLIDGITFDEDIICDIKFTDQADDFHCKQIKLYALAWEHMYNRKVRFGEVIYINSTMNVITKKRFQIDGEVRDVEFPALINRIKYYDSCLRNKTLPDTEPHNCNFCVYEKLCATSSKGGQVESSNSLGNKLPETTINLVIDKSTEKKGTEIKMSNHPVPDKNIKILL